MSDLGIKLIRSDFILSKIRELYGVASEIYHKWHAGGAFNGAAFSRTNDYDGHFLDVYFYPENHATDNHVGNKLVCRLPEMQVVVECLELHSDTEKLILDANRFFLSNLEKKSDLVSQVQRLQIWLGYECPENNHKSNGKDLIEFLFAPFKGAISSTSPMQYSMPMSEKNSCEMDGEILLENLQSEATVIDLLKPLLPEIKSSLYGFGFVSNNCVRPEMKWIHLTGRHF